MMRCRSLAEMPVRRVEISEIARNHIFSGLRVLFSTVPEVSDVWCPQASESAGTSRPCRPRPKSARPMPCRRVTGRSHCRSAGSSAHT